MFPKIQPDYVHTTQSGSRRTTIVLAVCLVLCLNELWTYLGERNSYNSTVRVDTTTGQKVSQANKEGDSRGRLKRETKEGCS